MYGGAGAQYRTALDQEQRVSKGQKVDLQGTLLPGNIDLMSKGKLNQNSKGSFSQIINS